MAINRNYRHKDEMRANTKDDALAQPYRVFKERMKGLFLPALLLTGSIERAEACFIRAIDLASGHSAVDDAFIYSVARRCVIKAAIEVIAEELRACAEIESRQQNDKIQACASGLQEAAGASHAFRMDNLLRLNPLRRAALVLRLFEKYHRKDMALLLGVSMSVAELATKRGLIEYLQHCGAIRDLSLQ
jgi:hypothetical protein